MNDIQVPASLIETHGAVSLEVAQAMAIGSKQSSGSNISLAITGIAGPTGGSADKPVGTVCFAWSLPDGLTVTDLKHFDGDRSAIREQSVTHGLHHLIHLLKNKL
jgi:nicotinamide-nucleotide amidase